MPERTGASTRAALAVLGGVVAAQLTGPIAAQLAAGGRSPSYDLGPSEPRPEAYSWIAPDARGAAPVEMPFVARTESARIDFGEAGVDADTLLYLPFNEGRDDSTRDLAGAYDLGIAGADWVSGRFGHGLAIPAGWTIVAEGSGAAPAAPGTWTLEFWVRIDGEAEAGKAMELVGLPGVVQVTWTRAGRVRVRLEGPEDEGLSLWSRNSTRVDGWSHVAVARDGGPLRQLRLILDDEVRVKPLAAAPPSPEAAHASEAEGSGAAGPGRATRGTWVLGDAESRAAFALDELRWVGRAVPSAELLEREAPATTGEYELALHDGTERRSVRRWAGTLTTESLAGAELGAGRLRQVVASDAGLERVDMHWERDRPSHRPAPRTTHPTLSVGDGRVWIFGGEVRDTHIGNMVNLADTWVYSLDEARWRRSESADAPPASCHQGAAFSPDHGLVLYAGGWRNEGGRDELFDGTWVFDVESGEWTERHPSGDPFPPTAGASLVYHPPTRRFVLFRADSLWSYDPEGDAWERLPPPFAAKEDGTPVLWRPGTSMMAETLPDGRVFLFGGERLGAGGEMAFFADSVFYEPKEHRYLVLDPGEAPAARVRSGFAYDEKRARCVLYGGVRGQDSERFDDLWTFDPAERRWRREVASGAPDVPGARGGYYGMARDSERDLFVLACGRASRARFLDEVWRLRVAPEAEGTARYVFDRASFLEHRWLEVRWQGPEGALTVRTRSSEDGHAWTAWSAGDEAPGGRFVDVELRMAPASDAEGRPGAALRVTSLGFRAPEATEGAAEGAANETLGDRAPSATTRRRVVRLR